MFNSKRVYHRQTFISVDLISQIVFLEGKKSEKIVNEIPLIFFYLLTIDQYIAERKDEKY